MHFFDRHLEEQFPEKLLLGGIIPSLVLMGTGALASTVYIVGFTDVRHWPAIVFSQVVFTLCYLLIVGMVVRFRRTRELGRIPTLCVVTAALATVAIGGFSIGVDGGALMLALLVLPAVAVGLFGDVTSLVLEWVVAVGTAIWAASQMPLDQPAGVVVVLAIVTAGVMTAIALIMRSLARNLRLSEIPRTIDSLVDESMTFREAMAACLSRISEYLGDTRAIVFVGEVELGFEPALTWPPTWQPDEDLDALGHHDDLAAVARSGGARVTDDNAILSVGYADEGAIVVVMKRSSTGVFAVVHELPYDVVADALSQVIMRVNSLRRLRSLGNTDPLTGLYNRRVLMERLALEIDHRDRGSDPLCLAMIDLDDFKAYNDTYGHLAGDEVLKSVAGVFAQRLRKQDSASRYGGEEFCLVLPDTDLPDAIAVVDALRLAVHELGGLGRMTFSAGIARYEPGQSPIDLIARADAALYDAKAQGRDRVVGADPTELEALRRPPRRGPTALA